MSWFINVSQFQDTQSSFPGYTYHTVKKKVNLISENNESDSSESEIIQPYIIIYSLPAWIYIESLTVPFSIVDWWYDLNDENDDIS